MKGTNQDTDAFFQKVVDNLKKLAPDHVGECQGRYHNRGAKCLLNHWKTNVAREVKKFNRALLKVFISKPTGVGDQEKINMAAAIHLGKIDTASHRHKDFPAGEWKFYMAWQVLKDHKMFAPPQPKQAIEIDEPEEEEDDVESSPIDGASGGDSGGDSSDSPVDLSTPVTLFSSSSKPKSRGPGPGRTKTKNNTADN